MNELEALKREVRDKILKFALAGSSSLEELADLADSLIDNTALHVIQMVEREVPGVDKKENGSAWRDAYSNGWDEYRAVILSRLATLKGEIGKDV